MKKSGFRLCYFKRANPSDSNRKRRPIAQQFVKKQTITSPIRLQNTDTSAKKCIMKLFKIYCQVASSKGVVKRALQVAIIVGAILNVINQGWAIAHADFGHINYIKMVLTFLVPYLVSTYSSTKARLTFKVNEVSSMDAVLQCKSCKKTRIFVNKGEIVPPCHTCGREKTQWRIVEPGYNQYKQIENEHQSMALFAQMNPAPVIRFNVDGIITQANTAAQNTFEEARLEGIHIKQLVSETKSFNFPEFIQNGDIASLTTNNKQGITLRFELRGLPQYGAVQMYGADITEIVASKQEANKFLTGVEQTSNSIMITNKQGEIEYVNAAFEKISGYSKQEVLGENPRFLKTGHTSPETYKELWQTISDGNVWHGQMLNKRKNGTVYWEESTISPVFNKNGEIDTYIAIKEDVTEKRQIKQELGSMALFAELNPEPVFRFNAKGIIIKANSAANSAFKKENIEQEQIEYLMPEMEKYDNEILISQEHIETIEINIYNRIFRFIMRGIAEHGIVQTYGSDITERKHAEEKIRRQKESIDSSIQYASRIQRAVLPSQQSFTDRFVDSFILYKPRDVVSGDFYWIKQFEQKTIIVAADCTGHGVPGAFMSMLGVALLNEIVNKNKNTMAGIILDQLRFNLKATLAQNEGKTEAKDGMDMSLCIVDHTKNTMQFAGAYNSIYIIRNNELIEYKADKMPIGSHIKEKPHFTSHNIDLVTNDAVYMLSDGYPDQFGGDKGLKFSKKALKNLINTNAHLPMQQQKKLLDTTFETWKNTTDQIDDVLVMGFRI
jgi:PAS domain S-box-containing protein